MTIPLTIVSSSLNWRRFLFFHNFGSFSSSENEHKISLHLLHIPETIRSWSKCLHQVKNINTSGTSKYLPDPTWSKCPVLFMINWEKFLFIPRLALGHFPLTFLCSEISGWVRHLSVSLVQPSPRDERWDGHIVMVLTFCGTVNIAARARIRSTSFFTSWNCQRDLRRVISLLHDGSGTISMDWLLSLRSKERCPPTSDLMNSNKHPLCFVRGSRSRKREFPWNIYNLIERLAKIAWRQNI